MRAVTGGVAMESGGADILDLIDESIFVRDVEGRIRAWNKASEELYGRPRTEAVGRLVHDLLKTQYPAPAADIEAQVLETGRWEGELKRVSANGAEMTILARWSVRRDQAGRPLEIVEIGRDITARKKADEALRYSEHRYHNLFQAMAASFWELDFSGANAIVRALRKSGLDEIRQHFADNPALVREMMRATRVIDVNDQTVALFGRGDKEELLGSVEPFWPEESTQVYAEAYLRGAERQANYSTETRLRKIDGSTFDALFTVAFPPATMGKGSIMVGVIDITARKQAYAELEQSEQRYRNLFHYMPMSLTQIDARNLVILFKELRAQGVTDLKAYIDEHPDFLWRATDALVIEEVNEHNVRMFGARDASEMLGPITRYWRESPGTIRRAIEARYRGEPFFQEETKVATFDGRVIDVLFSTARPALVNDKSLVGFLDITARVRAQQMLQQVQAEFAHAARVSMLGELTASIAHEVNQPLAAIATNGEAGLRWLARPEPDIAEALDLTKRIVADARRAADIIARIRAMATGRTTGKALLSLDDVIQDSMLFLGHELQSRRVKVSLDLAPGLPPVLGDRTQLQQVIVNLAVNAMQAMARADSAIRTIAIRTAPSGSGAVSCSVEDNGPGIDADHLGRLFESFFTTKDGGMGMGLPICRSIIEAHGGKITADNASAPRGARFSFTLPAAHSAA